MGMWQHDLRTIRAEENLLIMSTHQAFDAQSDDYASQPCSQYLQKIGPGVATTMVEYKPHFTHEGEVQRVNAY